MLKIDKQLPSSDGHCYVIFHCWLENGEKQYEILDSGAYANSPEFTPLGEKENFSQRYSEFLDENFKWSGDQESICIDILSEHDLNENDDRYFEFRADYAVQTFQDYFGEWDAESDITNDYWFEFSKDEWDEHNAEAETFTKEWKEHTMEVEKLTKERDEARKFAEEACKKYNELLEQKRKVTCVYCGYEYPEGTPESQHELLHQHILTCEKHPVKKLSEALCKLMGIEFPPQKEEIDNMSTTIQKMAGGDKEHVIVALFALNRVKETYFP